jgi:hypothetical protein
MIVHWSTASFCEQLSRENLNLNPVQNQSIAAIWPLLSRIVAISPYGSIGLQCPCGALLSSPHCAWSNPFERVPRIEFSRQLPDRRGCLVPDPAQALEVTAQCAVIKEQTQCEAGLYF